MVDKRFAFITDKYGEEFQVLKLDENGEPVDWDEGATQEAIQASVDLRASKTVFGRLSNMFKPTEKVQE